MDPLSALELTQVVFDNTVRLFKFLSALVDFPSECEKYRLQLIIEYNRVLAWAKAVGLIDSVSPTSSSDPSTSSSGKKDREVEERNIAALASALNTNSTELILILSRIQWLLAEFRELNERYGNELIPDEVVGVKQQPSTSKKEKEESKGEESPKRVWKPQERKPKDSKESHHVHEAKLERSASPSTNKKAQAKPPQMKIEASLLQISSLALSYDQSTKLSVSKEPDTHRRGTNHIRRFLQHTKDVITHPVRVRWVMVDQEAFEALLLDLHSLTERLHELMRNHHQAKMDDIVAKTYREMILARNGIGELQDLVVALGKVVEGMGVEDENSDDDYTDHEGGVYRIPREKKRGKKMVNEVRDLVRLKRMAKVSEQILRTLHDPIRSGGLLETEFGTEITVTRYGDPNKEGQVDFLEVFEQAEPEGVDPSLISRPRGYLSVEKPDGSGKEDISVWIEWKAMGDYPEGSIKERESYLRTLTLAQMLRLPKPVSLHVPECIGCLDDRDAFGTERYGLVFKYSDGQIWDSRELVTLYDLLGIDAYKPSISQRVDLALKLCSTVLNLHAVNWLHKGVLSANVILPLTSPSWYREPGNGNDMLELERDRYWDEPREPLLSGFEYSRPEHSQTTARSLDTAWDLYRWPAIQREHPTDQNSRKTYDLYSLGLLLLEIGHWRPLHEILHLNVRDPDTKRKEETEAREEGKIKAREKPSVPLHQSKDVREWLLETHIGNAPFASDGKPNPLRELRNTMGDRYRRAVQRCLWAHGPNGFGVEDLPDQSTDSEVGIRLQEAFTRFVIEELETVRV